MKKESSQVINKIKMRRKNLWVLVLFALLGGFLIFYNGLAPKKVVNNLTDVGNFQDEGDLRDDLHPLTIEALRQGEYPGSTIVIEETLAPGSNYDRYIASYQSEGFKIYALLTVPQADRPSSGWPVIVFNHGFIPPGEYQTTERYVAYTDGFSRNGYIVFRPDYRGHGNSEGEPSGAYGSSAYIIDVLNAVSSLKKYKNADSKRIGMWGHSMGGHITLRTMVVNKDIKGGVIWAGVVGSYSDLLNSWRRSGTVRPTLPGGARRWRQELVAKYGSPEENPEFWSSISATSYLSDISGPLQLHHGTADASVPFEFSQKLHQLMKASGETSELYLYQGDDHNLSNDFNTAMQRSIEFFDTYVKE